MILSYNWLQKYFEKELPNPQELSDLIMTHSFEVEKVEEITLSNGKKDTIFDIDVLPNRAHDCLSHYGMAKEIASLTGLKLKELENKEFEISEDTKPFGVKVEDSDACRRYIAVVVEGVKVGSSPDWLKESLEAIGQKSINNIVDATNYVMFSTGQPLHAFDKDKLDGEQIIVRWAKNGEKITTLDNKEVELGESNLIIDDEKSPLAIAGVKGGKKAEVDENTKNLVLEAANFKPVIVRKTARGFAILTDSSKRFENEISPELAEVGMSELVTLIKEIASDFNAPHGQAKFSAKTDIYPRKPALYKVGFTTEDVNKILGINISKDEVKNILNKLNFEFTEARPLEKVLELAPSLAGIPYESGASIIYDAPNKFDCSSFVSYLFAQAGVAIPRISVDQYLFGNPVSKSDLKAGD
ncbi:NlpC/P60 family protein, partial [Candidatus Parcubacteria bacterium]|nr:NlpC/P60 family protein [Candidatus Parcubacteria bacterium]